MSAESVPTVHPEVGKVEPVPHTVIVDQSEHAI